MNGFGLCVVVIPHLDALIRSLEPDASSTTPAVADLPCRITSDGRRVLEVASPEKPPNSSVLRGTSGVLPRSCTPIRAHTPLVSLSHDHHAPRERAGAPSPRTCQCLKCTVPCMRASHCTACAGARLSPHSSPSAAALQRASIEPPPLQMSRNQALGSVTKDACTTGTRRVTSRPRPPHGWQGRAPTGPPQPAAAAAMHP